MLTLLTGIALAASPFEPGALEPLPHSPTDVAIVDGELLLYTADGLHVRSDTGWVEVDGVEGGEALLIESTGSFLTCGPKGVVRYGLDTTVLSESSCVAIRAVPGGVWALGESGVFDPSTDEPVDLEGPIDALGGGPERAWLRGNTLMVGDTERLVFPGATDIARIEVPGIDARWLLVHPERKLLGMLGESGLESAWPQEIAATAVAVGDLDNDGSIEVVIAGAEGWTALTLTGTVKAPTPQPAPSDTIVIPPPRPVYRPPQTTSLLGIRMPNFGGLPPDPEYDQLFIGGFGLAVGGALGSSQLSVGFSPGAMGGVERGSKRIRSFFGADSAPLFAWFANSSGIHLAMATAGISVGSDRVRAGPFASVGLLGAGAGFRAVFTPFESRQGKLTGIEARLTWFAPSAGHASVYYVSSFPLGRRARSPTPRPLRGSFCHRFGFGIGAAGGASSTELAWEFVGRSETIQYSGSPAFAMSCENGRKATGWMLGMETAPLFFYRVPTLDGGADRELRQMGSLSLGLHAGGNVFRFGPVAQVGIWTLGAGFRGVFTPISTPKGAHHGLEIRALALYPSAPSVEGMALYHIWFDPKAKPEAP